MHLLIMGGHTTYGWDESRDLSEQERPFARAAHDLGYEAARRGHTLILGDDHPAFADVYVMDGIKAFVANNPDRTAAVLINRSEGSPVVFGDVGDRIEVRRKYHTETDRTVHGTSSLIPNLAALDAADVSILIGGKTTTRLMGNIAADRSGGVLAIPSFGGAAYELYGRLKYAYKARLGDDYPGLAALNSIWSDTSAADILDVAEALAGIETKHPPHSYFMSYTWTTASIADHVETLLLRNGRRVLRDETMFDAGEDLSGAIKSLIGEADTYIALYSEEFAASTWCPGELNYATQRKRRGEKPNRIVLLAVDTYDPLDLPIQHASNLWKPGKERAERDIAIRQLLEQEHDG